MHRLEFVLFGFVGTSIWGRVLKFPDISRHLFWGITSGVGSHCLAHRTLFLLKKRHCSGERKAHRHQAYSDLALHYASITCAWVPSGALPSLWPPPWPAIGSSALPRRQGHGGGTPKLLALVLLPWMGEMGARWASSQTERFDKSAENRRRVAQLEKVFGTALTQPQRGASQRHR